MSVTERPQAAAGDKRPGFPVRLSPYAGVPSASKKGTPAAGYCKPLAT